MHPRLRTDLTVATSKAVDQDGYSSLLDNNARRRIDRDTLRMQMTISATANADVLIRVEKNRVRSNILLFSQQSNYSSIGLQYRF